MRQKKKSRFNFKHDIYLYDIKMKCIINIQELLDLKENQDLLDLQVINQLIKSNLARNTQQTHVSSLEHHRYMLIISADFLLKIDTWTGKIQNFNSIITMLMPVISVEKDQLYLDQRVTMMFKRQDKIKTELVFNQKKKI